jgi:LemA protein
MPENDTEVGFRRRADTETGQRHEKKVQVCRQNGPYGNSDWEAAAARKTARSICSGSRIQCPGTATGARFRRRSNPSHQVAMNPLPIFIGIVLLNLAAAAVVLIEPNRNLFVGYLVLSFMTALVLFYVSPVVGIIRLFVWFFAFQYSIRLFNRLTVLANNIDVSLGGIRVALTRRQHILPRMERYVSGYARHERETFRQTVQARGGAARNLLVLAESYPALQASRTFQGLLAELVDAENQVYAGRIAFNEAIRAFNTDLSQFPNVIIGRAMGFARRSYETIEQNL